MRTASLLTLLVLAPVSPASASPAGASPAGASPAGASPAGATPPAPARPAPPPVTDTPPELPEILGVTATATSTLADKGKRYEPWFALGSDPAKYWCEGRADEGLAEALTLRLATPTRVEALTLRAGVWRSPELFAANNRITALEVEADDGKLRKVTLREQRENVEIPIGAKISTITIRIGAVAKGKTNQTCISGIDLHTSPVSQLVLGADAASSTAFNAAFAKAHRALAACDVAALGVAFPFALHRSDARATTFKDAKALAQACKAGTFDRFIHAARPIRITSPAPARLSVQLDVYAWDFTWTHGAWQLSSLDDHTP